MKKEKYKVPPTYLFPFEQGSDLAPFSVARIGCQGFIGPVPPPFFISLCNELMQKYA